MKTRYSLLAVLVVLAGLTRATADDKVKIDPDVVYGHKHGLALTLDVFTPTENANGAGVLFMVSGGWYSVWHPPERAIGMFRPLLDKGFTVFAVRHGSSPKFNIPEIVDDVRRSVRFVRANAERFGIDPDRLGVSGGSAGGHLSLVLGTTGDDGEPQAEDPVLRASSRVAAVVAYFPPTDLREFVNQERYTKNYPALLFDADKVAEFSPALQASPDDAPSLLIHGDRDELVPISNSEQMLAAFQEQKVACELLVIEGAAHGFQGPDADRASAAWAEWLEKHLGKKE